MAETNGMTDHDEAPPRSRSIGTIHAEMDDTHVGVDHVYLPEGFQCDDCGDHEHDPGFVGLKIIGEDGDASVLLTTGEALVLANRLQRAASLVLESEEDIPDIEREAAKFGASPES